MSVHKIRLIDHTYDLETAQQLLKKFIDAKIAFINERIEAINSDQQAEIDLLTSRLKELKAEQRTLDIFMEDFEGEHVEAEIGSTIVISIKNL